MTNGVYERPPGYQYVKTITNIQGEMDVYYDPQTHTYSQFPKGSRVRVSPEQYSEAEAIRARQSGQSLQAGITSGEFNAPVGSITAAKEAERYEQIQRKTPIQPQETLITHEYDQQALDDFKKAIGLPDYSKYSKPFGTADRTSGESIVLSESQYKKYQISMRTQIGKRLLTESEAQRRALIASGYKPQTVKVSLSEQYKDAQTIQKAGFIRTSGAILSSTSLFAKAAETEARGIASLAGFKSNYPESVNELMTQTASRLRNKPSFTSLILESPITAAIPIGAGFKVGGYLARTGLIKAGGLIGRAAPKVGSTIASSEKLIEPALTVGGVAYVGSDILISSDVYEATGKIAGYGAMTPGAVLGYKKAGSLISQFQTRGLKTISTESIIKPEVLSGKETFPTTRAGSFEAFKPEFRTPEGKYAGYHATPEAFGKSQINVQSTPSRALDVPGLYISPFKQGASPAFLRIQGESGYKTSLRNVLTSSSLKPEISLIKGITDIRRIPGGKNVQKSRQFLSTVAEKASKGSMERMARRQTQTRPIKQLVGKMSQVDALSKAYIEPKIELGGFKGEAQAVLAPGTLISGIETASRIKYKGYYVPLVERSIITGKGIKKQPSKSITQQTQRAGGYFRERQYYESGSPLKPLILSYGKLSKSYVSSVSTQSRISKQSRAIESSISKSTSRIIPSSRKSTSYLYTAPSSRVMPISSKLPVSSKPVSSISKQVSRITQKSSRPVSSYRPPSSYAPPPPKKIISKIKSSLSGVGKRKLIGKSNIKYITALGGKTFKQHIASLTMIKKKRKATRKSRSKRK